MSLDTTKADGPIIDIFTEHEYIYDVPRRLSNVTFQMSIMALRIIVVIGLLVGLYYINKVQSLAVAYDIILGLFAFIDLIILVGFCKR